MISDDGYILIIDDEPSLAEAVRQVLTYSGFACKVAHSCEEAFQIIQMGAPGLIISDVNMPCRTGLEFVVDLREKGYHDVPVIFLSGTPDPLDIEKCMGLGAKEFISKPIDPGRLISAVQSHCLTS